MSTTPASAAPEFDNRALAWFAVPLAFLTIIGYVGDAFAPTLLKRAPLLLLACSARLRNLVLVSPSVDAAPFFVVGVARLVVADPLFFAFGRKYGDSAIRWMEQRLGSGAKPVLWMERMFKKAAWPMVALLPNNWICLLAGAAGLRWGPFLAVNIGGTMVRVALVRLLGDVFAGPILAVTDWIGEHALVLTLITFGIVMITVVRSQRRGQDVIETPGEIAEELDELSDES
jgi:membrane protein DedA with SNARE-associated domain